MKVLIAVPTFENIYPDTFKSIYDMDRSEHDVTFEFVRGYDAASARNRIAQRARELGVDYVMMVDSDVVIPRDALTNLIDGDADVCLGFYARKNTFDGRTCIFKLGESDYTKCFMIEDIAKLREQGRFKIHVHGGGLGCALIKTKVFDEMEYPYFRWIDYKNGKHLSEDLFFCSRCKESNIGICMDTRVGCGHMYRHIRQPM